MGYTIAAASPGDSSRASQNVKLRHMLAETSEQNAILGYKADMLQARITRFMNQKLWARLLDAWLKEMQ